MGPQTQEADLIHATKYRGRGEDYRQACNREAGALQDSPEHFKGYRNIRGAQKFLSGGRVQSAMGSPRQVTAYNCFVSGKIMDSFVDDEGSIMQRATEAAETMRRGGGIGYDFSTLRPRGEHIRSLDAKSSGPIPFMDIFNAVCGCVSSSGHRRGAQMGVLRVDHPDIQEFIHAKRNDSSLTGFNVSVGVTHSFMEHLERGALFPLEFDGETYEHVDSTALWEEIMRGTWDWAEPGVLFIDTINDMNNLWYCETIAATNPCGEQPLPPYGACLLGSFNLVKYLRGVSPVTRNLASFDWETFRSDIPHVVRAMDNVVDRTTYPLPQQETEAKQKRRMGLGVTAMANAFEALGAPYGEDQFLELERDVLRTLANESYRASALLAKEKGAFPLFDRDLYMESKFIQRLDDDVRDLIAEHGIRNSHLTSIAPTGTISLTADNVSSGIEPVFAVHQERDILTFEGRRTVHLEDYGHKFLGVDPKPSSEVTIKEHLDVLAMAQHWVDSSVSKTCNVPPDMPWDDFKNVYVEAYKRGCKGITTFNPGGKRFGILRERPTTEAEACRIDPVTGEKECGE